MQQPAINIYDTPEIASATLAGVMANLIRANNAENKPTVLGLATGSTPLALYRELIRLHEEGNLSFRKVVTFNLDEYIGLERGHPESYWTFMWDNLFSKIDILEANVNIPDGTLAPDDVEEYCETYERKILQAGGLDLQVLGIGRTGHIGFNEPGSVKDSPTRLVVLNEVTREDAAPTFGGSNNVPREAITMGCGTILRARKISLLAFGKKKAGIVRAAIHGEISDQVPASYLQKAPHTTFYLDREAASEL